MEILKTTHSLARLGGRGTLGTLVALSAWTSACGLGGDPVAPGAPEDQVVVHSVLVAGADTVMVVLTRTLGSTGQYGPESPEPLSGATVRLSSGADTLQFMEQDNEARRCLPHHVPPEHWKRVGCYLGAIPGGVRAGATYELRIEPPGHGTIQGRATVPAPPTLREPAAQASITVATDPIRSARLDPVPVRWDAVEPGHRLELVLRTRDDKCWVSSEISQRYDSNFDLDFDLSSLDSASIRHQRISCGDQEPADSYLADLSLTLFDTAYARYLKHNGVHRVTPRGTGAAGITGALGVFAGAATTKVPVTLLVEKGEGARPAAGRDLVEFDH
jgi:hypothetical protein